MRHCATLALPAALGFLGVAACLTSASAGPLPAPGSVQASPSAIEKIDLVTKCWETPSGRRRCRTFYVNPAKLNNPDRFPVGSTEWWRAMDRSGRGGYLR